MWTSRIIKFTWTAIFSFIFIVLAFYIFSTIVMFIQNPDRIGVTFPERAIADAADLTHRNPGEIDGECSEKGSYFEKKVSCEMRRIKDNKITDTISLEYELMFDSILSFSYVRENLE
ncbi:hypothetical protein CO666_21540 [Rhizobium chutanense]|uniref:Uncharacterized protein n=2 Tax=Rhizobium chutanense TaxID=2035448 RepID=A0A2A6J8A7_9HYPH|nr:hypothetical protein CO666_21540 [Rhizobium chutanense]